MQEDQFPYFVAQKTKIRGPRRRQQFTKSEEAHLINIVRIVGTNNWNEVARLMINKNARQCKERWASLISNKSPWTKEEDELLTQLVNKYGHIWAQFTKYFKGRSPNNIKNRWNNTLSKKLEVQDICALEVCEKEQAVPEVPDYNMEAIFEDFQVFAVDC